MKKTVRLLLVGYVEWTVEERYKSCLGNNIVRIRQLFKKFRRQLHIEIQRKYEKNSSRIS